VRASHILLKTEGKDDAAVKAKAEDVLSRRKPALISPPWPRSIRRTRPTRRRAAILDFFGKGRMVPEFDAAAFAMEPGQNQRPRQDSIRLSHHQAHGQETGTTRKLDEVART